MTLALVNLADQDATPLPFPWSRIKRTLDGFEARFVRGGLRLQAERVKALRPMVEDALRSGLVPATVELEGNFQDLVEAYVGKVLVEGIVQGDADVRAEERRARAAGVNLAVDGEPVVPKEAITFIESRRDLSRFFDPDQVEKVRTILGNSLREGATVKQTMDALQTALPGASRARLENIARTEATAAYNQGRVVRFLQSKGFIQAVRFDAILDSRVTDICEHRNGLLFALDDPRLRQNTPPLHYQCRSVLTPVSGYKLEKMGGRARLDADRAKMDDAPDPQVTKKGRFGNEPWPDVPGGAAPAPRAKPVGPKGASGSDAERSAPAPKTPDQVRTPQRITVDALPNGGGPEHSPTRPNGSGRPADRLKVVFGPNVTASHPAVRGVLEALGDLPEKVLDVLRTPNLSLVFDDRNPFTRASIPLLWPAQILQDVREAIKGWFANPVACAVGGIPRPGDIAMFFRPRRLLSEVEDLRWAAYHEAGHAIHRLLGLVGDPEILRAFQSERMRLKKTFRSSENEFIAEGFAYFHHSKEEKKILLARAPLLHGIIGGRMVRLRDDSVEVLYHGPEGIVTRNQTTGRIAFCLDLGNDVEMAAVRSDGAIVSFEGDSRSVNGILVSKSETKRWTPEEAEPYKAFLRSKGVTLPHVMS